MLDQRNVRRATGPAGPPGLLGSGFAFDAGEQHLGDVQHLHVLTFTDGVTAGGASADGELVQQFTQWLGQVWQHSFATARL